MGRLTFVKIAVASLVLATATVRAETPTYLYGTSSKTGSMASVATTTPTTSAPRAAYVVAAETNTSGALEVVAWQDTTISLVNIGSANVANGLAIQSVAASGLDANRVVTADVDSTGALSIDTWVIGGAAGVVQQNGYSTGPGVADTIVDADVSITTVSSTLVVTAFNDSSGNVVIQAWTISSGGLPTPLSDVGHNGPATQVAIATINSGQVITAAGTGNNSLKITVWTVDSSGVQYQNGITENASVSPFSDRVAIGAGSQLVFEEVNGFPSLVNVGSAFVPMINAAGNVEVWYLNISASGNITVLSKPQTTKEDFLQVAACMLRTDVPITAFGDVSSYVHVGWYGDGTDDVYEAIKGHLNGITSIGAAAAGSDYKVYLPVFNAYFVTGVLTYTDETATNGDLQIRVWSYPVSDLDL